MSKIKFCFRIAFKIIVTGKISTAGLIGTMVHLHLLAGFSSVQRYGTVCSGELLSSQIQNCCIEKINAKNLKLSFKISEKYSKDT